MRRRRIALARPPTNSSSIPCSGANLLERLLGVDDRQRHKNRPRPRRNLVDVEVKPVGKENNLRRNRRNRVVVVLAQRAEIHLGEGVALHHPAVRQHPLAALCQARIVRPHPHQLGGEIALDRKRDIARDRRDTGSSFHPRSGNGASPAARAPDGRDHRSPARYAERYSRPRASNRPRVRHTSNPPDAAGKGCTPTTGRWPTPRRPGPRPGVQIVESRFVSSPVLNSCSFRCLS